MTQDLVKMYQQLRWLVNLEKSELEPKQVFDFVDYQMNLRSVWVQINYIELKAVFLAIKEIQDLCSDKIVLVGTDNTTVVSYINKEGGMRSGPYCAILWRILTWCSRKQVTLKA